MRILNHDCSGHAFTAELSRELARLGNEVLNVSCSSFLSPKGPLKKLPDDPAGFQVADIDLKRPFERFSYSGYSYGRRLVQEVKYGLLVVRQASAAGPEIVLSSNAPLLSQLTIAGWCRLTGVSFVWWLQDFYSVPMMAEAERRLGRAGRLIGKGFDLLERLLARLSSGIVSISEDFGPKLAGWGVDMDRVVTIHNWASVEDLPERPQDNPWSRAHGLAGRPALLYAGTLGLKHNPELLWRLAGMLAARYPEARLVVVSEGSGMDWLQEKNAEGPVEQLILLPFQPFEDFADVLAAAEVLVSILEPTAGAYAVPSKVLSYYCAARPILAAMPPANLASRTIVETGSGFVVAPMDEDGFLERAATLLEGEKLREEMGAKARAYAETNFGMKVVAPKFVEVLGSTLGRSGRKVAPEAALARLAGPGSAVARLLRPLVNRLVPSRLTTVSVLSGRARGLRMPVLLREEKFYWTGLYEPEVQRALADHLKAGDTFWDLGAHAGFFTILASRLVGPEGSVVAVEPVAGNRGRLSRAIAENGCTNVSVVPAAVGARSGEADFYPARSSLMGSLVPSEGVVPTRLECVTLDDLGEDAAWPALVKIDVEGAELDVLRAGRNFLSSARPLVIVEMPESDRATVDQAKEILGSYEFRPLGPSHQLLLPKT